MKYDKPGNKCKLCDSTMIDQKTYYVEIGAYLNAVEEHRCMNCRNLVFGRCVPVKRLIKGVRNIRIREDRD